MKNLRKNKWILGIIGLLFCGITLITGILIVPSQSYSDFSSQTIGADTVVLDNRTGLYWEVKTVSNTTTTFTWAQALTYCETTMNGYAGYSDWRVPSVIELSTIVDVDKYSPAIDTSYFPNTQSSYYWSATTYASNTTYAWGVVFNYGYLDIIVKTDSGYVLCVR